MNFDTVNVLINSALAASWIALAILAACVAAGIALAGERVWHRIAVAWHTRRLIRDVQLYVSRPALRPLFDTHDQPRKETP